MIDMHSHIIPMVDDGSRGLSITERMFKEASNQGFTGIFATPHYIDRKSFKREDMLVHFSKLVKMAKFYGIELLLGNEVFICPELPKLVQDGIVSKMNDSRYLLMELPRNNEINYLDDVVFELGTLGVVPIIAHPERYRFVHENPECLFDIADKGVLFQLNSGSLIGDYGESVKKVAKKLLKCNVYQFMGSDAHSYDRYRVYDEAREIVSKLVGDDVLEMITKINPGKVKNDEEVFAEIRPIKKGFLFWR